jgi:PAS domain S-box-containing protein
LRASEERFRRFFELGLIGMAMTSPTNGCMEVNQELCRLLGYSRAELLRESWTEMTHPEDRAADAAHFQCLLDGQLDTYSMEKRWIRKDGEIIHTIVSASCVRRADGSVDYFVELVQDITERKRAEEELRRTAAHLADGQRLSHTGSWSWNVRTGVRYWSEELFRIFGYAPEEVAARKIAWRRIHSDDVSRVWQSVIRAVRARSPFELEYRVVLRDGTLKHVHVLGRPLPATSSGLEYSGVLMDVTERKRAEVAFEQAEQARVTRLAAMGEVAAAIAHEINQPLGAIVNNANACLRLVPEPQSRATALEAVQDIIHDAERASAIIKHIRALIKPATLERSSFAVRDLVNDVLLLAHRWFSDARVVVETRLAADLPRLSADRVQLQQLLLNLVINGVEAMSGADEARRVLTIDAFCDRLEGAPAVAITVTDGGVGFDPKDSERLFAPFHTTKHDGMGLGLRIGRSIVEAHGGRLWATSTAGAGATFHCVLPVQGYLRGDHA